MDANPRDARLLRELDKLPATDFRTASAVLEVPEARLCHLRRSPELVRLQPDWETFFRGLKSLGPVVFQLEGPAGTQRQDGEVDELGLTRTTALLRSTTRLAELRLLLPQLSSLFAVCVAGHPAGAHGFHVFDRHGAAAFRVLLSLRTPRRAFSDLVARMRAADQAQPPLAAAPPLALASPEPPRDPPALLQAWARVQSPADVLRIQREHGVDRAALYRALAPAFTTPLRHGGLQDLLERCVADEQTVAISMGNRAAVQVHRAMVERVAPVGQLLTVLDPTLTFLHDTRSADTVWIVRRPSPRGLISGLEVLGPTGAVILSVRAGYHRSEGESWRWRRAIEHTAHHRRTAES